MEVRRWDCDRRTNNGSMESMRSRSGGGKAHDGQSDRRSLDEIQTGGCEAGPEKRAAGVVGTVGAETEGS